MIYELRPLQESAPEWTRSIHRGAATVRARSERQARMVAATAFNIAGRHQLGEQVITGPWMHSGLVSCTELSGSDYEPEGPAEILAPTDVF